MNRLLVVISLALLAPGCVHRWVGRPVAQLEKEYGNPRNIQRQGDNSIYYYPDFLAGRGEMTFTVDRKGIIRSWCATADVPGPWQDDIFGNPVDGPFNTGINNGINNGTNGGLPPSVPTVSVNSTRAGRLPQRLPPGSCPQ